MQYLTAQQLSLTNSNDGNAHPLQKNNPEFENKILIYELDSEAHLAMLIIIQKNRDRQAKIMHLILWN